MRVQLETSVATAELSTDIDHSWLFLASLIHARLYELSANDQYRSRIIKYVEPVNNEMYAIKLSDTFIWTDGQPGNASEIARTLANGQMKIGIGIFDEITVSSNDTLLIKMRSKKPLDEELLSSSIFTVTSQCRNIQTLSTQKKPATCGLFKVLDKRSNGGIWSLEAKSKCHSKTMPRHIELVSLSPKSDPLQLLQSGSIDVSAPLGLEASQMNAARSKNQLNNRIVNLGMVLRVSPYKRYQPYNNFIQEMSEKLDRNLISLATGGTYIPMKRISSLFESPLFGSQLEHTTNETYQKSDCGTTSPSTITINYVDFHPNALVAEECARQIRSKFNIPANTKIIDYSSYLSGSCILISDLNLMLEIIQPVLPISYYKHFKQIPLAQARSTTISFDTKLGTRNLITKDALIDWQAISNNM